MPYSLFRFLNFSHVEQHAGMHPVNARSCRIELQAAAVGPLGKVIESGVMVNIAELVPGKFRIWRLADSLS